MKIDRLSVHGFAGLLDLEVRWPAGRLLLVVDTNEAGKSSLCEAILAGLYGLSRSPGAVPGAKLRDLRRPRNGGPFGLTLEIESDGTRFRVRRDFDAGTLSVVDLGKNLDRTPEFVRSRSRDTVGEQLAGLTEALFRSTAYVGQNVLDRDSFDSLLVLELSKIADTGGGEGTALRAQRLIESARAKMPEPLTGANVSVDTEIMRAQRRVDERRSATVRRQRALEEASRLSESLESLENRLTQSRRKAALANLGVIAAECRLLEDRVKAIKEAERRVRDLEQELSRLKPVADNHEKGAFQQLEALRIEIGKRPEALEEAQRRLESDRRAVDQERRDRELRFGLGVRLSGEERQTAVFLLKGIAESERELQEAEAELKREWEDLRREGLAEDVRKFDALSPSDMQFLETAEEERIRLEKEGVRLDRLTSESSARASIVARERRIKTQSARGLLATSLIAGAISAVLALAQARVPRPVVLGAAAFAVSIGVMGAVFLARAGRYREEEEAEQARLEAEFRAEAAVCRKDLSDLRLRLSQISAKAGFGSTAELGKTFRKLRAAEARRRVLVEASARRDAIRKRRERLEADFEPFRSGLGSTAGLPLARSAVRSGAPEGLSLSDALLFVEADQKKYLRYHEILDQALPEAKKLASSSDHVRKLEGDRQSLLAELFRGLSGLGAVESSLPPVSSLDAARKSAEEARAQTEAADAELRSARASLAQKLSEGVERAREDLESLEDAEWVLERALSFRQALDLARDRLSAATTVVHRDFRKGLEGASRGILERWGLPYEALEFDEELHVTVRMKDGKVLTRPEFEHTLSAGTREQLNLAARLSVMAYFGVGDKKLPLLLDDPFTSADDGRFLKLMNFLVEMVLPERPILLVTCHEWRHERFLAQLSPEIRQRVEVIPLRQGASSKESAAEEP
ncbi:MAG: SMC family ATPase [Thermoanaerobaculia bacterium]|nr:SMC family ATPase [Thermoanaerobaculia bacterium]